MALLALFLCSLFIGCLSEEEASPPTYHSLSQSTTDTSSLTRKRGLWMHKEALFNGILTRQHHNGNWHSYIEIKNGKKHGIELYFYSNQKIKAYRRNLEGKRIGLHQGWWPDNALKFSYQYQNGFLNGLSQDWYSNGQSYKKFRYFQGKELGLQEMWSNTGRVLAQYEYKNGRRYGKVPTRVCEGKVP